LDLEFGSEVGWSELLLGMSMFTLMLGMGLTLQGDDFRRIATSPRATLVGTVLQLLVMPIVGIAIARFFGLSPVLSSGIVVLAACPGGMFSNMMVHLAKGNTALSVTLTATATLVTLFTLPLWVQFSLSLFAVDGTAPLDMPVIDTALRLGMLTVLPIAIGMGSRIRWPELAGREQRLTWIGVIGIVVAVTMQGVERPALPIDEMLTSIPPALAFAVAAMVIGVAIPLLVRIPPRETITIAVEMVVKNTLLGMVLVGQTLEFEAILPILAFGIFQTPGGLLLLVGWRTLEKRGVLTPAAD
jgi:BASS family bile acid:Na+ symporter